jgi:TRAP-type C4-dicarboxylate transport system permease small subunit
VRAEEALRGFFFPHSFIRNVSMESVLEGCAMGGVFDRINKGIRAFENVVGTIGLVGITILVFVQVLNRYLLHFEVMWLSDLALYMFIFLTFVAIGLTTRENGHTSVEVFVDMVFKNKPKRQKAYGIFLIGVSLTTVLVFGSPTLHFAKKAMQYPQFGTLVRWFNTSWLMESMLIMILLSAYHLVSRMHMETVALRSEKGPEGR